MTLLTLSPPPGQYGSAQQITVTPGEGFSFLSSIDGSDPVVVKTVASTDKLGTEQPYMQIVDDGRGRMVLDGAFTKFYNSQYSSTGENARMRFFNNILDYLCHQKQGPKKLLIIGDKGERGQANTETYRVKNTTSNSAFGKFMVETAKLRGYNSTVIDSDDYPEGNFTVTYQEMKGYDVIIFVSSVSNSNPINDNYRPTPQMSHNMTQIRREGTGILITTDHGEGDQGFYRGANKLLEFMLDAKFDGNYDFSPGTTVEYNRNLWGETELFKDLSPDTVIVASASDSNVVQDYQEPSTEPITLDIGEGYTQLKFAVVHPDGSVTFENYSYAINVEPIIQLMDSEGLVIDELEESSDPWREVHFRFNKGGNIERVSGFVKLGSKVVGQFVDNESEVVDVDWIDSKLTDPGRPNEIKMPMMLNEPLIVELYSPFVFSYEYKFNRLVPSLIDGVPIFFNVLRDVLSTPVKVGLSSLTKETRNQFPDMHVKQDPTKFITSTYDFMTDSKNNK